MPEHKVGHGVARDGGAHSLMRSSGLLRCTAAITPAALPVEWRAKRQHTERNRRPCALCEHLIDRAQILVAASHVSAQCIGKIGNILCGDGAVEPRLSRSSMRAASGASSGNIQSVGSPDILVQTNTSETMNQTVMTALKRRETTNFVMLRHRLCKSDRLQSGPVAVHSVPAFHDGSALAPRHSAFETGSRAAGR